MKISTCLKSGRQFAALLALILMIPAVLYAASDNEEKTPKASNLHVTSDQMVAEQKNSTVEFIGNVRATRDDSILLADSVKIFFRPSGSTESKPKDPDKKDQGNVEKIVATGKVEYTAGERKAYADKAVYTTADEKLVLTGKNPKLLTGKSWVSGKKITLFRNEERVMVESDGKNRVQAFFDSQDQKKGKSNQ